MKSVKVHTLMELPEIMSPQQIADYLGISRRRVYELCQQKIENGGLPSFTIGNSRKIEKADLIKWIEQLKAKK